MGLKNLLIIAIILLLVPIFLGKVDAEQVKLLLKNPSQMTDLRVVKLVFGDLIKNVADYYKTLALGLINDILGTAKEEIQKKEVEIKIK